MFDDIGEREAHRIGVILASILVVVGSSAAYLAWGPPIDYGPLVDGREGDPTPTTIVDVISTPP